MKRPSTTSSVVSPRNKNCPMAVTLELYELKNICMDSAALGVAAYERQLEPKRDAISQREAYRLFGEATVRRWVEQDVVKAWRDGRSKNSPKRYSRAELMAARQAERMESIVNR